jgi:hypothetical protein
MSIEKYEAIPERHWTKLEVTDLLERSLTAFLDNLSSIVYDLELESNWKSSLIENLLFVENIRTGRNRLWNSLSLLLRCRPLPNLSRVAENAWGYVSSFELFHEDSAELASCLEFLEDLRVFATDDSAVPRPFKELRSSDRYNFFVWSRVSAQGSELLETSRFFAEYRDHDDFVFRESVANALSLIYSRPDCSPESLGPLMDVLKATVDSLNNDPSWYVRKAADTTVFFEREFRKEYNMD